MKKIMIAKEYCSQSGFPIRAMRQLLHCSLADEFSFRTTPGRTAPYYINTAQFEKMLAAGEFKEVLEG